MKMVAVFAAAGAGATMGWVCGLIPVWPVARIVAASVMGVFVGAVGTVLLVLLSLTRTGSGGLGAVSLGLSEAVILGVPTVVLVSVVGYFVLRRMGWNSAGLAAYGPIIAGGGTALLVALWVIRGLTISGDFQ